MGRTRDTQRWRCRECRAISLSDELLTAPNPFCDTDEIKGCPACKGCTEGFSPVCDEPGCEAEAGCGWPTLDNVDAWGGYRSTCGKHYLDAARKGEGEA